ncbi:unnamed protein product [Amoebophrya sp. A120]|nr:unnamed protein product [Amoebophrya sp. A120]|eukprot:GSA120T00007423001.1
MRSGRGAAAFFDHIDHFCTAQELGGLPGTTAELHQPDLFASVSPSSVGINSHVDSGCSGGDLLLPRNSMIRSCKNSRPARGSGFSSLGTTRTAFIPEAADADEQAPEPDVPDDGLPKKGSLSKKTPPPPVFGMTEQGDKCQCNLHDTDGALTAHTAKSKDFEMRMKEASKDSTAEKAKVSKASKGGIGRGLHHVQGQTGRIAGRLRALAADAHEVLHAPARRLRGRTGLQPEIPQSSRPVLCARYATHVQVRCSAHDQAVCRRRELGQAATRTEGHRRVSGEVVFLKKRGFLARAFSRAGLMFKALDHGSLLHLVYSPAQWCKCFILLVENLLVCMSVSSAITRCDTPLTPSPTFCLHP